MAARKDKNAIRKPAKNEFPVKEKPQPIDALGSLYEKFVNSEKGSSDYERLGNKLMNKVFSGK